MKDRNICKFITGKAEINLEVTSFIYETNDQTMKNNLFLNANAMILMLKGGGTFDFDGSRIKAESSDVVFGFEGESFHFDSAEPSEYMYIVFSGERAQEMFRRFGINKGSRVFSGFERLIPLWKSTLSAATAENIDLCAESMLLYAFSCFNMASAEGNEILNRITEITENNFSDSELSVTSIAEELGYNPKYISHLFKNKMGVTFSEYLRDMRIRYAVTLFDHGIDSVKNVAFLSGYKDPLYFSSVFKSVVGKSPKDYKEK
jgi:AraC-like DNA-binding protein